MAALALAACGSSGGGGGGGGGGGAGGGTVSGNTLTIYSSLPLQGASRTNSVAVNNGAKLALKQRGNKVGKFNIKFVELDDSTASAGKWDPAQTQQDARKAIADKTTIAYLGEFNSGATANSLPKTNRAGILQVSPSNTAVGLTSNEPGADVGEPDKYYPTGKRTYARVVPKDTVQAAAQVTIWKENGCKKVYIVNDKEVYGLGLAKIAATLAPKQGIQVAANEGFDPKAANYRSLAGKIKSSGADCFFGSIIVDNNGVQLFSDIGNGVPNLKLFGPDGVAEDSFTQKKGGLPANIAARTLVTVATLSPSDFPPEGKKFFADYTKEYNDSTPEPYAIYGYESMQLILNGIEKAGAKGNDRQAVIDAVYATKGRKSVLGTYDIDKNGDTTLTDYGLYTIKNGQLTFDKVIKAGAAGG
jgi:branched-chain amino acid transport system substrate-binding protein